jgi:deoxyribodipyrimidine photolyase
MAAGECGGSRGGEGEALRQLRSFLARISGGGGQGGLPAASFSSCVAPWLATGCLSPRRMLEDARAALGAAQQAAAEASPAFGSAAPASAAALPARQQAPLDWVRFELWWRDFFRFMTLRYSRTALPAGTAPAARQAPALAAHA